MEEVGFEMSNKDFNIETAVKDRESAILSLNDLRSITVQNIRASENNSSNDELLLQNQTSSDSNAENLILRKDSENSLTCLNEEDADGLKKRDTIILLTYLMLIQCPPKVSVAFQNVLAY